MSTRQSIVYVPPVHIYEEGLSNEICIELFQNSPKNEKYDEPILTIKQLKQISEELNLFLKDK